LSSSRRGTDLVVVRCGVDPVVVRRRGLLPDPVVVWRGSLLPDPVVVACGGGGGVDAPRSLYLSLLLGCGVHLWPGGGVVVLVVLCSGGGGSGGDSTSGIGVGGVGSGRD
jgi:hypothetical protein